MALARLADGFRRDLLYGVRVIRANPGFTAAAVLSLALGIAANTSIFTLVDQVLLRLLPVEKPRELVQFRMEGGRFGNQNGDGVHTFSYPLYNAFRDRNTVFSGVTGFATTTLSLGLKDGAGSVTGNREHVRMRKTFVALQVSTSLVLLIGAGLFVRTLDNLREVDLGFTTDNVVMFAVSPATRYEPERKLQLYRTLMERLATVPGVRAVGANTSRLLTGGRWDSQITIEGAPRADGNVPWSFFNAITPGYFEALGIPVTMGRDFTMTYVVRYRCRRL